VASLSDLFSNSNSSGNNLAFQYAAQTPQYRLNETAPALQEDASIATSRALQDYSQNALPQLQNQGASMGQWGSSGLSHRADLLSLQSGRQVSDTQRMLARNLANIAQQRVMAAMGAAF
jgi:hypothetical protein